MFSNLTSDSSPFNKNVINTIKNPQADVKVKEIMGLFSTQSYAGWWKSADMVTLVELPNGSGSSRVRFQKYNTNQNIDYEFEFKVNNGLYADEGNVIVKTIINLNKLVAVRDGTSVKISYKKP